MAQTSNAPKAQGEEFGVVYSTVKECLERTNSDLKKQNLPPMQIGYFDCKPSTTKTGVMKMMVEVVYNDPSDPEWHPAKRYFTTNVAEQEDLEALRGRKIEDVKLACGWNSAEQKWGKIKADGLILDGGEIFHFHGPRDEPNLALVDGQYVIRATDED